MMTVPAGGFTSVPARITRMVCGPGESLLRTEYLQVDGSWGPRDSAELFLDFEEAGVLAGKLKAAGERFACALVATHADAAATVRRRAAAAEVALASVAEVEPAAGRRDWHVGRPNCGVE